MAKRKKAAKSKRKKAAKPKGKQHTGLFILHRFCGDEAFVISEAKMFAFRKDKDLQLWFEANTDGECVQQLEDTSELYAKPKADVRIHLKQFDPEQLVGQKFKVTGYDKDTRDPLGMIYYVEHDELMENVVEVLGREGNVFEVRWTGITTDVNYYDGSKPKTQIEIVGRFTFREMEKWKTA
ncbi:MAG: hypothetical protein L0241_02245 [Planctomycetia bacterium]|nr:hypothetical protein [Planctomycetia bacterium]